MRNLFDHFRRKAIPAEIPPEKIAIPAPASAPPDRPVRVAPAMTHAIKPSWHGSSPAPNPLPKSLPGPQDRKAPTEMLTLTLGDFLDRIPPRFLDGEDHDRSMPLPFDLGALSERIGRGSADIPVTEIYRRVPDIFSPKAVIDPELTIRFPWQKVLAMVTQAREGPAAPGLTAAALEMLSIKLKARKFRRPPKMAPAPRERAHAGSSRKPQTEGVITPISAAANSPEPDREIRALTSAPPALAAPAAPDVLRILPKSSTETSSESAAALELARLKADYEQKLAAVAEERDKALAEIDPLRKEFAGHLEQVAIERREAAEVLEKFSHFQKEYGEIVRSDSTVKAERDAAQMRADEFGNEHDAAIARAGEFAAERDAAVTRAAELTAERDAAVTRIAELTAERDATVTRTTTLIADAEAAISLAVELTTERDSAVGRMAELTAERDASVACAAELLKAHQAAPASAASPEQTAWEARTLASMQADIEDYRARIQTLLRERDALREERGAATKLGVAIPSTPAKPTLDPASDAYAALFPKRLRLPRATLALALGLVGIGIAVSRIDLSAVQEVRAEDSIAPVSLSARASSPRLVSAEPAAEAKLSLEVTADEATMALLPWEPLLGANRECP